MFWLPIILIFCTILIIFAFLNCQKPDNFPPGPKWYPIIGSALQIQKARLRLGTLYEATAEMCLKYGPVLGLKVGTCPMVVVYGPKEIKELGMSEDLLGRPIGPYYDLRTWSKRRGVLLTDNKFWLEQRRFLLKHLKEFGFGSKNISTIIVEDEVTHLINYIEKRMDNSDSVVCSMETFFTVSVLNSIWKMVAGVRYSPEDEKMQALQSTMYKLFKIIHMVGAAFSYFPILKYLAPKLSGYKIYMESHEEIWKFLRAELERHKKTHQPDNPRDLMDIYLDVLKLPDHDETFSEDQLVAICMDMFMAGSETTSNTLAFGFLYLTLNLDIQKKAQQEIDAVLGNKFPSLFDKPNLPYVEAISLEALRMFGCRAFAVPHRALRDTHLGGYFIPKDVLVTANLHGCMMGPDSGFEHPEKFIPERYFKDGEIVVPENHVPFGIGKRRCLGASLARTNIFLFITALLQKYEFHVVPEKPPDMKILDGVTPSPSHYLAKIVRRKK